MKPIIILALLFITLFSTSVAAQTKSHKKASSKTKKTKHKKELVYLFAANGGMVGYFSDGSVVGCPKCDFCKSNILAMFKEKPFGTWDLKNPEDFSSSDENNNWVLVNYKWKQKVPQF